MDNENQPNPQVTPNESVAPNPSLAPDNTQTKKSTEEAVKATHSAARWVIALGVLSIVLSPAYEYLYLHLTKTTNSPNATGELVSAGV